MVAVVSKLLLLVALFSGIENAVSSNLSFNDLPQSLPRSSLNALKSGKSSKSLKSGKKSKNLGIGKGSKSPKAAKYLHVDGDLTVEYKVVEEYESTKSGKAGIHFQYTDVVEKPVKKSKDEASSEGSDGVKTSKADTDTSATKSSKASKWSPNFVSCSFVSLFITQ